MGYFDGLTASSFKMTEDGRMLFFPFGALGRGYVIPSQREHERLRVQMKTYFIVALVLIIGSAAIQFFLASFAITALLIVFYFAWISRVVRRLEPSDERLSFQESMTAQAVAHGVVGLWVLEAIALVLVCLGILVLIVDRESWLIALTCIVFFGLCAALFARMLVLRRRRGTAISR